MNCIYPKCMCDVLGDCAARRHEATTTSESAEPKAKAERRQEDSVSNRAVPVDRLAGWWLDAA